MITDTTSQSYRIAETLALMRKTGQTTESILDAFFNLTSNLKFWERLAIKETFHHLCKE